MMRAKFAVKQLASWFRRRLHWIAWSLLLILIIITAYELRPLSARPSSDELYQFPSVRTASQRTREIGDQQVSVPLSWLVRGDVLVSRDSFRTSIHLVNIGLRWDNIILAGGGILLVVLLFRQLATPAGATDTPPQRKAPATSPDTPSPAVPSDAEIERADDAHGILLADVQRAAQLAEDLYSRSTLLLGGGIIMAFIGIAVFWVSLPAIPADPKFSIVAYLPHALRPLGMLLFVEAIAWFLLRQYRALIEDYKSFNRVYLRRVNLLAALRIAGASLPLQKTVLASLVSDDVSGRLAAGETTETIEALKHVDANPILQMIDGALKTSAGITTEKPKVSRRKKS